MGKLSYNNLLNLDYKYIFDYYDRPLSFIGFLNSKNYLFHYIDEDVFFVTELTLKLANKLSRSKNLTKFYSDILDFGLIKIIHFNHEAKRAEYIKIDDADFDVLQFLPKSNNIIDYDYYEKVDISQNYNLADRLNFPFETRDLTVRVLDQRNSSTFRLSTIEKITSYIRDSFNILKENVQTTEDIFVKPYTVGSFKMNFVISSELSLFEEKISFSPVLDILQELNLEGNRHLDLDIINEEENVKLIESISRVYEELKNENVSMEFYRSKSNSSNDFLTKLSPTPIVNNNIDVLMKEIDQQNKLKLKTEFQKVEISRFVTGSLLYNTATIAYENRNQKIRFEKDLFKKIKNGTVSLNLDKQVSVELKIESSLNSIGEMISKKYIVQTFQYL